MEDDLQWKTTFNRRQQWGRPQKDGAQPSFWRDPPSKVVIHKGHLMVNFHQRSSSIEGCLPSKVVLHQRSSSIKGRLTWRQTEGIILKEHERTNAHNSKASHPRSSSIKGCLPSKVVFHGGHLPQEWIRHQTLRRPQRGRRPQKDGPKPSFWRNLPSKVVIHKGPLPKEVIFHQIRFNRLHNSVTICWLNHMPMLNACAEAHAFASLTQWKSS